MPKTKWGFPVDSRAPDEQVKEQERGVAMLIAILVSSMIIIFTSDMIINSTVNLELAVASRDNVKAEYLAKSGVNLAQFVIGADWGIDVQKFVVGGELPSDGRGAMDIWQILNGIPIGYDPSAPGQKKLLQETFGLSSVNDSKILDQLDLFQGIINVNVEDEASKINVNYCAKGRALQCLEMIQALMNCPAEKEFLDRKKLEAVQIAANIKDWVDFEDPVVEGSVYATESDPYEGREPPMSAKNAPFDSLDELKIIEGWDDEMHAVFSPYLTVFPVQSGRDPRININTISRELLMCLLPESRLDCQEKAAVRDFNQTEDPDVLTARNAISQLLITTYCQNDDKKLKYFTFRSDVFRVEATGIVGEQKKKIDVVIQRQMPDPTDKRNEFKGSYKFLYWKMI